MVETFKQSIVASPNPLSKGSVRWRWDRSENFSVKSLYLFLQNGGVSDHRFHELWRIRFPLKVKIFAWLVLRGRVSTLDRLRKRGWTGASSCVFCQVEDETVDHLFLGCCVTRSIFLGSFPDLLSHCRSTTVASLWSAFCLRRGPTRDRELLEIAAVWWAVWLERNRRIFDNRIKVVGCVCGDARGFLAWWSLLPL